MNYIWEVNFFGDSKSVLGRVDVALFFNYIGLYCTQRYPTLSLAARLVIW